MIVDFSCETEPVVIVNSSTGITEIVCSYRLFSTSGSALSPTLLSENRRDCNFYHAIGSMYAKKRFSKQVKVKLEHLSGAGSECITEYGLKFDNDKFCICIVDNDKKHPDKGEGETSSHFKRVDRIIRNTTEIYVLDVREVESLIPANILLNVITDKKLGYGASSISHYDQIVALEAQSNNTFRQYFDHKEGLTLKEAFILDSSHGAFWVPYFSKMSGYNIKPCKAAQICVNTTQRGECESCIKISGLGDKILKNSIPELQKAHLPKLEERFTPPLKENFDIIGHKIISWGCSLDLSAERAT